MDYKNVLFNRSYKRHEMDRIQSKDHDIGLSYRTSNIFLSYCDDKKYQLKDGTFSHFDKSTRQPRKNNFVEYRQFALIFALICCFQIVLSAL